MLPWNGIFHNNSQFCEILLLEDLILHYSTIFISCSGKLCLLQSDNYLNLHDLRKYVDKSQYPAGLSLAIQLKSIVQGAFMLEHVSFLWTVFVQCWPKQVYYYSMAAMSGPEISPESPVTTNPYGIPGWANFGNRGFWFALSQTCLSLTALVCPT